MIAEDATDAALVFEAMMAHVPVDSARRRALWQRMTAPDRHYHDGRHLSDMWRLHERFAQRAGFDPVWSTRLVASSIAYHDAVHVAGRLDNEIRSAELWLADSQAGGIAPEDRAWVAQTIRATADHLGAVADEEDEGARLRRWVLDLDLASLGASASQFEDNTRRLRLEAMSMDETAWRRSLRRFMTHLAESRVIFRSPPLFEAFEAQARRNIEACLSRL